MTNVYSFHTGKLIEEPKKPEPKVDPRKALFELILPPKGEPAVTRVLVDGLVPLAVAKKLRAICVQHNRSLKR